MLRNEVTMEVVFRPDDIRRSPVAAYAVREVNWLVTLLVSVNRTAQLADLPQ